jgi:hypothetical protein
MFLAWVLTKLLDPPRDFNELILKLFEDFTVVG